MKKSNFIWTSLLIISIACILYILFSDISITDDTNNGDYLYLILFIISAVIIFSYVIRAKIKISEEYCDITNAHEKYVKTLGNKIDELEKKKSELENINKDNEDAIRKPAKLEPARKSGKERHTLYGNIDDESDDWSENYDYKKKESVLDYFDDGSDD